VSWGEKMKILEEFNIVPNDISLYEQAFIHTSYAYENNIKNQHYERLEFLGDAILELTISEYLFLNTALEEGKMTKLRASYVCEKALYNYAININLGDYIKLGKGEKSSDGQYKKAILADAFESFIGAIYLD